MKPHEVEWSYVEECGHPTYGEPDGPLRSAFIKTPGHNGYFGTLEACGGDIAHAECCTEPEDRARMKLAAAAPEMARLLLRSMAIERHCVFCNEHVRCDANDVLCIAHEMNCELVAVLRRAGVGEREIFYPADS